MLFSLVISHSAVAAPSEKINDQSTCLIGEQVASGTPVVVAMLEALAQCNASIETIIKAAITASPDSSINIVREAIATSPEDAVVIVQTAMTVAPSQFRDDILTVALEEGVDPGELLQATAAGNEAPIATNTTDTNNTETNETTETSDTTEAATATTLPSSTSPTPNGGGEVSPS